MEKKLHKLIYWAPRVLAIMFIVFLSLFSLDVFDGNYGFWGTVLGLFMHNIPVFILTGILIIAWKYEIIGAIVFILAGLAYMILTILSHAYGPWCLALAASLILAAPAFLIGILFFVGWFKKKPFKA